MNIEPTWSESFQVPFKRLKVRIKDKLLPLEGGFDIFNLKIDFNDSTSDLKLGISFSFKSLKLVFLSFSIIFINANDLASI